MSSRPIGLVPSMALVVSVGVIIVALADLRARSGIEPAEPLFWIGLAVIVAPIALVVSTPGTSRSSRVALLLTLGVALYVVKLLHSPSGLTFYDEFSHLRTAEDILVTGHPLASNPLQPISALYPGLEALTALLASTANVPLDVAGVLVVGLGRVLLILALFVFFERLSGSSRTAAIGVLVYVANPSFLFFDAQFSYESLAVPLAVAALAMLVVRGPASPRDRLAITVLAIVTIGSVAVTHHVTSYVLTALLVAWFIADRFGRRWIPRDDPGPGVPALAAMVIAGAWLVFVATSTIDYLAPHLIGGATDLVGLATGGTGARRLFASTGFESALWERIVASASLLLLLGGVVGGVISVWRRGARSPLMLVLTLAALAYPASLALRLTARGAESAGRASAFLFVSLGIVIAIWAASTVSRSRFVHRGLVAAWLVVFAGGAILGFAPWARLPYPYVPGADSRSVEAQGVRAASWVEEELGAGRRIAADRTNRQLIGTIARGDMVSGFGTGVPAAGLLLTPRFGDEDRATLRAGGIEFVVTDRRLSEGLPPTGVYVESGETGGTPYTAPIGSAAARKFDDVPGVSRLYDDGEIQIFDVRAIR